MISRAMLIWSCAFCAVLAHLPVHADEAPTLATVSYRRSPNFYNGVHTPGVWYLKPGDEISTGDGRAYATAQYPDSTRLGVTPKSQVIFHPHWVDVRQGGLDVDLVAGTEHVEQIETPLGIVGLEATTGTMTLLPPSEADLASDTRQVRFVGRYGHFQLQLAREDTKLPPITLHVDAGDNVIAAISDKGNQVKLVVLAGEVDIHVGSAKATFTTTSRGHVQYLPSKQSLEVVSTRGEIQFAPAQGKATTVAAETSQIFAVPKTQPDNVLKSRRGEIVKVASASPEKTEAPATSNPDEPAYFRGKLPQDHPYQRVLRNFMANLTERDLDPGDLELTVAPPGDGDRESLYRMWLLTLDRVPRIGRKRSAPSVSAPARLFLLKSIEGPESIMRPPSWPEPLTWFANWDYPGNPYYGSTPLKLRAFVTASTLMMLVDHLQENSPELGVSRTDSMAHHLVLFAYCLPGLRDAVPPEVAQAYETGLRKLATRMLAWGPGGEDIAMDLAAAVGLYYTGEALDDDGLRQQAKEYARPLFTDPEFFHPAGYFVSQGAYDASYNGQPRFYAVWLALASGYDFTREPIRRCYRLRAHLSLPEPDGTVTGPCHFNWRTSRDAYHDQYEWPFRDYGAAMLTDEAAHLTKLPTDEELATAGELRVKEFVTQIKENPGYAKPEELEAQPWYFRPWPNSWSFPQPINYAQEHYLSGSLARREKLEAENSPLLKLPLDRDENFVRTFDQVFTVAKQDDVAVVLHTGPIGQQTRPGQSHFAGPYGLGGGQLSAFWTRPTGAIILGRRGGMNTAESFDLLEQWKLWPQHAVSGTAANGRVFTSGQIRVPEVHERVDGQTAEIQAAGQIPVEMLGQGKVLQAPIDYQRTFELEAGAVQVTTQLSGTGRDKLTEMVETIPVFLREMQSQRKQLPTRIEFLIDGKWQKATSTYQAGVTAVRLSRFAGQVQIDFDRARRVRLADSDWQDNYMSRAACRNILIDLLENDDQPVVFENAETKYRIHAL